MEARQGVWRQGKACGGEARCVEVRQGMWRQGKVYGGEVRQSLVDRVEESVRD